MAKKKVSDQIPRSIPLKTPNDIKELERAIVLIGSRINNELREKQVNELKELVGAYPTTIEAMVWKQFLKGLRKNFKESAS